MSRTNKYHAYRSGAYDSQAEKEYADLLDLLVKAGEIAAYKHHPPAFEIISGLAWRLDYLIYDNDGQMIYVDVKGFQTPDYKTKLKLWMIHRLDKNLLIVKRLAYMCYQAIAATGPAFAREDKAGRLTTLLERSNNP